MIGAARYDSEHERLHALHGEDRTTRAQAASHEAGHAIVATSFGWQLNDARILRDDTGGWYGFVNFDHECVGQVIRIGDHPKTVFAEAITLLAGAIAERRVGVYHPCGSLGELIHASDVCGKLDVWAGVESGSTLARAKEIAAARLQTHAATFDLLRAHLARTRRLLPADGRRMLRAVTPSPIEFPYPQKESPRQN
ncbi:hypothetical protein WT81_33405 [Burkholderia stagnalis]|nr:hypothetical protein WT80_00770 [Burkholderia stagnalis]KWK65192.1 hypothetical protein WT81_33405 [Burkholderia stagnalis]KWN76517.1 hypothetical protein WT90_00645 [Burkholderia stagnalis]